MALPLVSYGVPYATGIAFGLGLQVIEMSVGIGLGLLFLMLEGLSLATLRQMPADGPESGEAAPPRRPLRALAAPASLKGVLSAREAAAALAEGWAAVPSLVADGGEGTLDVVDAPRRSGAGLQPAGSRQRNRGGRVGRTAIGLAG